MNTHVVIALVAAFALVLVGVSALFQGQSVGSVAFGGEYSSAEISTAATTTIKTLPGTIGSVVIDDAGTAGVIAFYATTSQATSSADLVFSIDGSAGEGTYTYDVGFGSGLLVDHQAFDGGAVITFR